jgi:hypothetical protein
LTVATALSAFVLTVATALTAFILTVATALSAFVLTVDTALNAFVASGLRNRAVVAKCKFLNRQVIHPAVNLLFVHHTVRHTVHHRIIHIKKCNKMQQCI